nr:hypothetical protein [Tanacetum cinerariifolium]
MARQCRKLKRKRDATWFRDKVLLVEAQGSGKVLNEEELEFLADPGVAEGLVTQTIITHNATYQAEALDVYDSDCNNFSIAKGVLMANLSSYKSNVLFEKAQQIRPMLYDGSVIAKETNVISIDDSKETLMLEEESRSKMLLKQSDPMVLEKKVNIKSINYAELNRSSKDYGMYKLDLVTLAPKDKNNRETHIYYLNYTIEQAAILMEIVEQAKSLNPLDSASYFTCKYVKLIQELLGYTTDTCPGIHKPSKKLIAVMPINKKKIVRFTKSVISSSTSKKQLGFSQTNTKQTTNNYVSTSTGVSLSTKSSRSKSTDNTKNDRMQISSRTQKKNKVEDHSKVVKSCLNKPNCVVEPSENANVHHFKLNTNSELMCVICNSFMFDARYELCVLEFVSDMNASYKSKSVKKAKNKEEWKPSGKVLTKIGYNWRPTGRTFTLVGNVCLLTRITTTNKVPLKEPIPLEVVAQEPVVTKVYARRPK